MKGTGPQSQDPIIQGATLGSPILAYSHNGSGRILEEYYKGTIKGTALARSVHVTPSFWKGTVVRWMVKILHYLKDPKLWELWYIPYYA